MHYTTSRLPAVAALSVLIIASLVAPAEGQAPRTTSHQGLLVDSLDNPVADASRSMTFKIYDVDTDGTALWTETQSVATVDGRFNVILGSSTPISGFDLNQGLWLGIKVDSDDEMTPRTELTAVPTALGVALPYSGITSSSGNLFQVTNTGSGPAFRASTAGQTAIVSLDRIDVLTNQIGDPNTTSTNEDIHVQASDAQIGLYSNVGGAVGSGIQLGEMNEWSLVNKWSMLRRTTGSGASLLFTFGPLAGYGNNSVKLEIDTTGQIHASALVYDTARTHHYSVDATEFKPGFVDSTSAYVSGPTNAYISAGTHNGMNAAIHLPDGAVIKKMHCYLVDSTAGQLLCQLGAAIATESSISVSPIANVTTTGTPGFDKLSTDVTYTPIDNETETIVVSVVNTSGNWSDSGSSLAIKMVVIEYEVSEAQ